MFEKDLNKSDKKMYPLSYQMIRYTYTYFESVIKINKKIRILLTFET